jgi:hypothetical protein
MKTIRCRVGKKLSTLAGTLLLALIGCSRQPSVPGSSAALSAEEGVRTAPSRELNLRVDAIEHAMADSPQHGAPRAALQLNSLLFGTDAPELDNTAASKSPSVALAALWQLDRRTAHPRFDPAHPFRVLRYLDAQFHIPIPPTWAYEMWALLLSERGTGDNEHGALEHFGQRGAPGIIRLPEDDPLRALGVKYCYQVTAGEREHPCGFRLAKGVELFFSQHRAVFSQAGKSFSCDAQLLPKREFDDFSEAFCALLVGPRVSFVAFPDDRAGPYALYCVDSQSGSVRWAATVWSLYPAGMPYFPSWSPRPHRVWLSENGTHVALFGAGMNPYLEVFDTATGMVVARFSTRPWPQPLVL